MSPLREPVIVHTAISDLMGHLFVGVDGLPELKVEIPLSMVPGVYYPTSSTSYRPATFPYAWLLRAADPSHDVGGIDEGILIAAWSDIERIQRQIAAARREEETEERRELDDIDEAKRWIEIWGER